MYQPLGDSWYFLISLSTFCIFFNSGLFCGQQINTSYKTTVITNLFKFAILY